MPIPEDIEPEPQVDTRMLEFVQRRREEQAAARRQRVQAIAITALGIIGIILTVSNAVLVSRLVARPATPPTVIPPPVRPAPSAAREESPPATQAAPAASEPTPPAASVRGESQFADPAGPVAAPARRESQPPALPDRS